MASRWGSRVLVTPVRLLLIVVCLILVSSVAESQEKQRRGGQGGRKAQSQARANGAQQKPASAFHTEAPAHDCDIILGRPTRDSVTLSILSYKPLEGYVSYGPSEGRLDLKTDVFQLAAGQPKEIVLTKLAPDARQCYRLCSRLPGAETFSSGAIHAFHTQRPPGEAFTFTITADSHLDERTTPAAYEQTLSGIAGVASDFHIDLGDTFMSEKHPNRESAAKQYLAQRYYFGKVAQSSPLYLVLGNHDGEDGRSRDGGADSLAVWSNALRKRYFPNPVADGFYTGDEASDPIAGILQDYYAWEWGSALFVVLDPFWFTPNKRGADDNWVNTLGLRQYEWLARTLKQSTAKYKFIFIHNLVGGGDRQSRGGAEAAPFYEWGGKNADGSDGFALRRAGWEAPIHQLLVRNRVTAVFHGHDHFFAKQELDGIVYQLVPQPATPGNRNFRRNAEEYGYRNGLILPSPGYLKVAVGDSSAKVAYIGAAGESASAATTAICEYEVYPYGSGKAVQAPGR